MAIPSMSSLDIPLSLFRSRRGVMNRGAAALILASVCLLIGCEREKTRLDREVDRLCAIDGGVRIYEKVQLPAESFGPDGEVFPEHRDRPLDAGRYGPDYRLSIEVHVITSGNPSLKMTKTSFVRNSDRKVLATRITYSRHGGDFPGPWQPSAKSCLDIFPKTVSLDHLVFVRAEK